MSVLKIGVVEDEIIIADNLCSMLRNIGYDHSEPANTYKSAIEMIEEEKPDLVLLDIQIIGSKDGIDVAHELKNKYHIPHIYLTANSDMATVKRAKETQPLAFLVKPFSKEDLYTTIEIAFHNFIEKNQLQTENQDKTKRDVIYVKEGAFFHKINTSDLLYLESNHVNLILHTASKKIVTRNALQKVYEELDPAIFVRVHRSYIVNINHIQSFNSESIIIQDTTLPLSKNCKNDLTRALNVKL